MILLGYKLCLCVMSSSGLYDRGSRDSYIDEMLMFGWYIHGGIRLFMQPCLLISAPFLSLIVSKSQMLSRLISGLCSNQSYLMVPGPRADLVVHHQP